MRTCGERCFRLIVNLRFLVGRFELHDDGAESVVAAHDGRFQEGLTLRMCFAVKLFAEVDAEELTVLAAGRGHLDNGLYGTLRFLHGRARHRSRYALQSFKRVG